MFPKDDALLEAVASGCPGVPSSLDELDQSLIPRLANDPEACAWLGSAFAAMATRHAVRVGNSQDMSAIPDASIHLVVTSPPYWTLKRYNQTAGQLGHVADYETFLGELTQVWRETFRVLVPGGRLVIVVGDVCLSRRSHGRHAVVPLHASIQEQCRRLGFDNLAGIFWHKIANARLEVDNGNGSFLGKPYEPNAILKNDTEFILMQRKPGAYRQPTPAQRILSFIPAELHREWFQQSWSLPGESTRAHPAPFPLALAERLVRMFSFAGDTVLDPFLGTGTTSVACARWGRHSVGYEIDPAYAAMAADRIATEASTLYRRSSVELVTSAIPLAG